MKKRSAVIVLIIMLAVIAGLGYIDYGIIDNGINVSFKGSDIDGCSDRENIREPDAAQCL